MSERTCETCRWWVKDSALPGGSCHAGPPVQCGDEVVFPYTKAREWCGEWTSKLVKLAESMDDSWARMLHTAPAEPEPQPVAYCIQCADDDPKVHSLSFDKAALGKIVTRHGGKVVPLYLGKP